MTLFRTVAPALEPVTLAEARQNLRIDHDSDDELLAGLIRAAREEVEASCGLALIEQSWRLTIDALPPTGRILLRRHPVIAVTALTVYGDGGEASVVAPSTYQLDPLSRPARLHVDAIVQPGL